MRFAYPVMLDVTDRLVVIIGGGAVAVRKVRTLLDCGATRIRVVAPGIHDDMPAAVERIVKLYDPAFLDGASLVLAATDWPDVNDEVVRDARARGILVNRTDDGDPAGDFVTPATGRQGQLVVAVSSGSPALSAAVRDQLTGALDDRHVRMSQVMEELRPLIRDSGLDRPRRAAILRELAGDDAIDLLARQGEPALKAWLSERYPDLRL